MRPQRQGWSSTNCSLVVKGIFFGRTCTEKKGKKKSISKFRLVPETRHAEKPIELFFGSGTTDPVE